MKRLLLAPLLLILTSCGYGSSYEASRACDNYQRKYKDNPSFYAWCIDDARTNKYVLQGYDYGKEKSRVVKKFSY